MGYVFNDSTGRVAAIFLQGTPTPPAGFTFTTDPIDNEDIIDSKRDIGPNLIVKRDALKISGSNSVKIGTLDQVAVQKIDGTTLADLTGSGDDDPVVAGVDDRFEDVGLHVGVVVEDRDAFVEVRADLDGPV